MAIGGVPKELALQLRDRFGIKVFVETGTYKGHTTAWAADHFEQVITVEAHREYFERAASAHHGRRNIRFIHGDSARELPRILQDLAGPALLWLDAHWCGTSEKSLNTGTGECPLREELQALNESPINHFVLIDDARLFVDGVSKPHDPGQWPDYREVQGLLQAVHPRTVVIHQDVIAAVPPEAARIARAWAGVAEDLQVTVLSSNGYLHCLAPFAYLFNKYFDARQPVTVVRHETRPQGLPGNFKNFAVGKQAEYSWSAGLAKYLQYLPDDLLLLMLEDYFIDRLVDVRRIRELVQMMEAQPEIAKIDLSGDLLKRSTHAEYNKQLVQATDDDPFLGSLQAALWRREYLLEELGRAEFTPWTFEKHTFKGRVVLGVREPAIHYVNAVGGEGSRPGQYDFKRFPAGMREELERQGLL